MENITHIINLLLYKYRNKHVFEITENDISELIQIYDIKRSSNYNKNDVNIFVFYEFTHLELLSKIQKEITKNIHVKCNIVQSLVPTIYDKKVSTLIEKTNVKIFFPDKELKNNIKTICTNNNLTFVTDFDDRLIFTKNE